MVTLDRVGGQEINKSSEFIGKSNETKPVSKEIPNGSSYLCIDSGEVWFFDADTQTWLLPQ